MNRLNRVAFFLICATVVLTTLLYGTVHQPIIALFYMTVAIIVLLCAADFLKSGTARFSPDPLQLPLYLLGGYALFQVIPFGTLSDSTGISAIRRTISLEPFATQVTAVHILLLAVLFSLLLIYVDSAARLRRLTRLVVIFGFAYAFYAILQSVLSPDKIYGIYKPLTAKPFGSFVNRHNFAAVIEMAVSLPLGLIFTGAVERDKRLLYIVAIALMAAALLLSESRGGLVAMLSALILLVIITSRAHGRKKLILKGGLSALLVIAAIGGAVFVGGDTSLTRFADTATSENVTSSRTRIWAATIQVISHNLPFGAGLGAFVTAYPMHDTAGGLERVEQAHNDYLQVVADAGLPGLAIGVLFLFLLVRKGKSSIGVSNTFRRGVASGALAGCFAILVHSLFDFVLHITAVSVMFLTLLAMLVASGRKYPDDIGEDEEPRRKRRRSASITPIHHPSANDSAGNEL
jgi:O-antigen ligase